MGDEGWGMGRGCENEQSEDGTTRFVVRAGVEGVKMGRSVTHLSLRRNTCIRSTK